MHKWFRRPKYSLYFIDIQYGCPRGCIHRYTTLETIHHITYQTKELCVDCRSGQYNELGIEVDTLVGDVAAVKNYIMIIYYLCNHVTIASNDGVDILGHQIDMPKPDLMPVHVMQVCQRCNGTDYADADEAVI